MYIPPHGIYFRLRNEVSGYVIYSRSKDDPEFYHYGGPFCEDQLFTLLYGSGERAGKYAIKGKDSGKVIFSRSSAEPQIGHISGDGYYSDK